MVRKAREESGLGNCPREGGNFAPDLRCGDLLWGEVSRFSSVRPDVLLEDKGIGVTLVAHGALVEHPHGGLGTVNPHVGLEVTLGGEGPRTDPTLEGPLSRVGPVVHLQSRLAAQHPVTDETLVGIVHFVLNRVDQMLQFAGLAGFHFDQGLPGVVITSGPGQQGGVDVGVFGWIEWGKRGRGRS